MRVKIIFSSRRLLDSQLVDSFTHWIQTDWSQYLQIFASQCRTIQTHIGQCLSIGFTKLFDEINIPILFIPFFRIYCT